MKLILVAVISIFSTFASASETGLEMMEKICGTISHNATVSIKAGLSGDSVTELLKSPWFFLDSVTPTSIDKIIMPSYEFGKALRKSANNYSGVTDKLIKSRINDNCMTRLARFTAELPSADTPAGKEWGQNFTTAVVSLPDMLKENYSKWLENPSALINQ